MINRRPLAWRLVGLVAAGIAVLLLGTINRYDYHRDELYFRLLGDHPGWGYVDQPPLTPLLARAAIEVFGDSLWAIRVPALLCALGTVFLVALVAREFGGGAGAQVLAALGVASAFPLVAGHVLVTATVDLVVWLAVVLCALRALLRDRPRWWLAAGALVGLGLYNKLLIVLLLFGLGVGLLMVGPWRVLRSGWLWAGVAAALVVGAPNIVYQIVHDFPQQKMAAALAENKGDEARVTFVPLQLVLLGLPLVPIWIAGLVRLWRDPAWRPARAFAVAYPAICVLLLVIAGQPYYTMGLLVALYAAGCVSVAGRFPPVRLGLAVGVNIGISVAFALPVLPYSVLKQTPIPEINQTIRDQVGWPVYVRQVAAAVDTLTPEERSRAVIITGNYGEAGAIDRYGRRFGLPPVYSGQNELYNLGPPPESAEHVVFVVQDGLAGRDRWFTGCESAGRLDNGVGIDNEEQEATLWVCRGRKVPWRDLWPRFQHYD